MEYENNKPIYLQVIDGIKKDIISGKLPLGDKMPSTRELAINYKINPNTAQRVYKELERENLCYTKRGLGTFVMEDKKRLVQLKEEMAYGLIETFKTGMKELGFDEEEMVNFIKNS